MKGPYCRQHLSGFLFALCSLRPNPKYLSICNILFSQMDCQNVLTWWRRTGRKMFPYLAPVAQQVFGNQAAVTQGRRDLSGCTNLLALNRSRLDTYWAEMVMFLKENFEQIPALKDIPTIAAKDIHECLPARFHGRDAGLVAAEAAFDVLGNTAYPSANDIVLEG